MSVLQYLYNDDDRQVAHGQLNKGESIQALRRRTFFANEGKIRLGSRSEQDTQTECLTLLTNAVLTWNTAYINQAPGHPRLQEGGDHRPLLMAAVLDPTIRGHIKFYGRYEAPDLDRPVRGKLGLLRSKWPTNLSALCGSFTATFRPFAPETPDSNPQICDLGLRDASPLGLSLPPAIASIGRC